MFHSFSPERRRFVSASAGAIAGAGLGILSLASAGCNDADASPGDDLDVLRGATSWLNTPPLSASALRRKVVVLDVWTYTCINWLRTLPYVRAWDARYRAQGLVVIGVHSPEFAFEHDVANVRRAVSALQIPYPVAIDNDFAIWRALDNHYWPALYVIDDSGRVRDKRFGEGHHAQSERAIRKALQNAGVRDLGPEVGAVEGTGVEAAADWTHLKSPEAYLGYERAVGMESPAGVAYDRQQAYVLPSRLSLNHWGLTGNWTIKRQHIALEAPNGLLQFVFHARDVHLVMGPSTSGASIRFRVRLDGHSPGAAHGGDIDAAGDGRITEQRLHHLIRQATGIVGRTLTIEFVDAGADAFAFTFG